MSIKCCICRETKNNFVTFECSHKICLKCYNDCIYHNHSKCCLCREVIQEIKTFTKLINNLKEYIENLKNMNERYEETINNLEGINEDLQDRNDELWAQIN